MDQPPWCGPRAFQRQPAKFDIPTELDWDLWLGTAPQRDFNPAYLPATWRGWVDFGTGSLGDMGCHFIDVPYRALKLGYPISVECSVGEVWTGFFKEVDLYRQLSAFSKNSHSFSSKRKMIPAVELVWYDGGIKPERPG